MRAVSIHGVTITWSIEGLDHDPLEAIFAEGSRPAGERAACRFALRAADPGAARDPRDEGYEPSFFHGIVQAYRRGDAFLLHDRASRVLVRAGSVEAEIAPPEREIEPGSAHAMLEIALALALRAAGLFHMHAAALSLPSGESALVVGGSGAGKTTTTLALIEAGARYLGDDALFLAARPEGLRAAAFPRAFHLAPATLAAFPRLAPWCGPPSGRRDKRPLDPRVAWPDRRLASLSLDPGRVLSLFPSIAHAPRTTIAPTPRADAFGAFLASSAALVIDGLGGRAENLALLDALLAASRCFELRLGEDALADPAEAVSRPILGLSGGD